MNVKQFLRSVAINHGFQSISFAKAEFMDPEAKRLENWLNNQQHATMSYMENHFDLRTDPTKLVPGAKTVISLMYNYYPEEKISEEDNYKIAKYAYGKDYHKLIRKKIQRILDELREEYGEIEGRAFVDSAPVMERDWARRGGLGWIGKNTLLISQKKGSFYLLGELIIDLEIEPDTPSKDYCGTCTRCIDACPTDAIHSNGYWLDSNRCISYLTIERKEGIPEEFRESMDDWIFGCDICQDVCPWNRFSTPHQEVKFSPKQELKDMRKAEWEELTKEAFQNLFAGSAVRRTNFEGLERNIHFIKKKK